MAAPRASTSWPRPQMASAFPRVSAGPLLLGVAVPLIFLHVRYQPDLGFSVGGTRVDVTLSDLAVLGVALTALAVAVKTGVAPLRHGLPVWLAAAAFLIVVLVSLSYPGLRGEPSYDWHARLVSALKFCEYAALALAAPLLVRRREDLRIVAAAVVAWSIVATVAGLLQYAGLVDQMLGHRPAEREPSLLGYHDFAALSGGALALGAAALLLAADTPHERPWAALALAGGGLGLVISGAMTGVIGMWLAFVVLALAARRQGRLTRRALTISATVAILVTLGTAGIRGAALRDFAAFIGIHRNVTPGAVESYAQRTVLGYIGLKIFLAHPVTGVGYQGSSDQWAYGPHLAAAHRRFPGQPADAFPSPKHPWGVQNLYIEALADLGVIGFAALAVLFIAALTIGWRGAFASPVPAVGIAWLLVAAGVWIGIGIVPGIPLAALTWLGFGLATVDG